MTNNTPAINATGLYKVALPFVINTSAVYTCESIAGFDALIEDGVDIFTTYYVPFALSQDQFVQDVNAGVNIITLMSDSEDTVVLPSSFITAFPNTQSVGYRRTIVSIDLGMLPQNVDLGMLVNELTIAAQDFSGITPTVKKHVSSITSPVSFNQHSTMESARRANIRYEKTTARQLKDALDLLAIKTEHIAMLEERLIASQ